MPNMESGTLQRLHDGQALAGMFWPEGSDEATAGMLTWSPGDGASLELIGETPGWPSELGTVLTVHGVPVDTSGVRLTLPDCMIRSVAMTQRVRRLSTGVVAEGAHFSPRTRWSYGIYRPANLHEWWPETGISLDDRDEDDARGVRWKHPPSQWAAVTGGKIGFIWGIRAPWDTGPSFTLDSTLAVRVEPEGGETLDGMLTGWGVPVLGFSAFGADRPESLLSEIVVSLERHERVEVLRRGTPLEPRPWRDDDGYLFRAEDLPDPPLSLAKWIELWNTTKPALGLFANAIDEGNSYSPARFLTLYSAAEGYFKTTQRPDEKNWSIDRLAKRASVADRLTGCSKRARALIGATRKYHAHLALPGSWTQAEIEEETYQSTRRLHALMQAVLMREVGMETATIEARLEAHYRNWPVPTHSS